jgi:hypothetical protein
LTVVGVTLGLSYGGGLLIQHARTGEIADRDVFFSMALLGLCHSLIEDTLVMSAVGAHHSGTLWGRLIFSLLATWILVRVVARLPERFFYRHLFKSALNRGNCSQNTAYASNSS